MALQNDNSEFNPFGTTQNGSPDPYGGMYKGEDAVPVTSQPKPPVVEEPTETITEPEPEEQYHPNVKVTVEDVTTAPVEQDPELPEGFTSIPAPTTGPTTIPEELKEAFNKDEVKTDPNASVINKPEENKATGTQYTPEQREAMLKNDLSNQVIAAIGNGTDYTEAMEKEFTEDQRDNKDKINDPSEYLLKGGQAVNYGFFTRNQILLTRIINELVEKNIELTAAVKELRLARISPTAYLKKAENGVIDGKIGGLAVIAATQGTYRVLLYNSGFNIVLRPITMKMADEFVQSVDRDFHELGRILGGFFHLPMSIYLKQKIAEFLPELIVNSNLVGWKDKNVLLNSISIHDYDTILWALGSMLFKEGVGIGILCCNKDCRNHADSHFIDLAKSCYLNLNKLKGPAVAWMLETSAQRTPEDVRRYKEEILGNVKEYTPEGSNVTYVMRDPSLSSFINHGCDIIGKLTDAINEVTEPIFEDDDEETKREKEIAEKRERERLIGLQMYRMLIPWIDHLSITDKSSKEKIIVRGYEAIDASLEQRANANSNLYNEMEDFIKDSKISYYCTSYIQCPKCGKRLDFNKNELTPIDMEYLFFFLSCLSLEQAGLSL